MKTIPIRTKWLLSLSPILAMVLLVCCYRAVAGAGRADAPPATSADLVSLAPNPNLSVAPDNDDDPRYVEARREYLSRLAGTAPGSISPEAFAAARTTARMLPPSPLLRGQTFKPFPEPAPALLPSFLTGTLSWLLPIPPPIIAAPGNIYGGNASAMVQAIAADPTDSGIVFTGSYGGLARSINGGQDWGYLSDSWTSQEVSSIAIAPSKPSFVYVGTGRDNIYHSVGLYASNDGGESWTGPLGVNEFQGKLTRKVAVDPSNFDTVYVANGCAPSGCSSPAPGLWRSYDGGQSWVQKAPTGTSTNGVYSLAIDSSNSDLYAATDAGLFTSSNDGDNWDPVPGNQPPGQLSVVDSVLYLLAGQASGANELSFRSTSGGTWTTIPTCPTGSSCTSGENLSFSVFAVEPNHPNVIIAGGFNPFRTTRLWLTENAGLTATWTAVDNIHVDQRAIAFAPDYTRNRVVYVGNDGGIIRSKNHGQTWTNCNLHFPGALLQGVAISKDDSMMGGTQDNGAVFSFQGGPWVQVDGGDDGHVLIDPSDSGDAYFHRAGARFWARYRHGQNPAVITITPPQLASGDDCHPLAPFSMSQNAPFYLLTACQKVVRSADNGLIWTQIGAAIGTGGSVNNVVYAICQAPSNSNFIYASANEGGAQIWVTTNADNGGSARWTNVTHAGQTGGLPIGTAIAAIAVDSTDPQTAYLACNSGIFKTTNTGGAWTKLSGATADAGYSDVVLDPLKPVDIFASSRLGVIASTNAGTAWGDLSAGLPPGTDIRGLSYNRISQQLAANTYGRGAYVIDLDSTQPSVSITSPAPGMVSGIVLITATASDNHRVVGVQFKRDGLVNIGSEDMEFPYQVDWNTTGLSGPHTLTAVARDPAGNTKISASVNVYVMGGD